MAAGDVQSRSRLRFGWTLAVAGMTWVSLAVAGGALGSAPTYWPESHANDVLEAHLVLVDQSEIADFRSTVRKEAAKCVALKADLTMSKADYNMQCGSSSPYHAHENALANALRGSHVTNVRCKGIGSAELAVLVLDVSPHWGVS